MLYDAIQASIIAHQDQLRKIEGGAYVAHPLEVAFILAQNGASEEVISAGILHDTIEDTSMTYDNIVAQFGQQVADIVKGCTEPDKSVCWQTRKSWAVRHVSETATHEMRLVICADKLSNIRSIHRNLNKEGPTIWDHFHAPFERQKWYYMSMLQGLSALKGMAMYEELVQKIHEVFG